MADTIVAKTKGRLLYIEPNDLAGLEGVRSVHGYEDREINSSDYHVDGHYWRPEDLNMSVDLQVVMTDRSDCGQYSFNDIFDVNYKNDNSTSLGRYVSFMMGSDINGTSNDGTNTVVGRELTTSYLTATYQELYRDRRSDRECLGIESIDITFDSHFYPQVNIKFIDVRGYSLMMPTDMQYIAGEKIKNGVVDEQSSHFTSGYNNFFRALFRFPYPRFLLTIKGYYGNSITFMLAVNEFKSELNASTGNFECNVSFIGYMYGLYTDIPFNFLVCAPYYDAVAGTEDPTGPYWNNGDFRFDNKAKIPTYPGYITFYDKLKQEVRSAAKGETDNKDINEGVEINKKLEALKNTLGSLFAFTKSIATHSENTGNVEIIPAYENGEDDGNIIALLCVSKDSAKTADVKFDKGEWENFYKPYKDLFKDKTLKKMLPGTFYTSDNEILVDPVIKTDCDPFYIYDDSSNLVENTKRTCEGNQNALSLSDVKNKFPKIFEKFENLGDDKKTNKTLFLNFFDLIKDIKRAQSELEIKRNETLNKNTQNLNEKFIQALGFNPTIDNFFRMIFAHLDCFITGLWTEVINKVKNPERKLSEFKNIDKKDTDLNVASDDNCFVPPFVMFYKNDGDKREEIYPTVKDSSFKKMAEVIYVEKLLSGAISAKNKAKEAIAKMEATEEAENRNGDSAPICLTDALSDENPYKKIDVKNSATADEILYFFICRCAQSRIQFGDTVTEETLLKNEVASFTNQYPDLPQETKDRIKSLKQKTTTDDLNQFIDDFFEKYYSANSESLATKIERKNNDKVFDLNQDNTAIYTENGKRGGAIYLKKIEQDNKQAIYVVPDDDKFLKIEEKNTTEGNIIRDIAPKFKDLFTEEEYGKRFVRSPKEYDSKKLNNNTIFSGSFDKEFYTSSEHSDEEKLNYLVYQLVKSLCNYSSNQASSYGGSISFYSINTQDININKSGIVSFWSLTYLLYGSILNGSNENITIDENEKITYKGQNSYTLYDFGDTLIKFIYKHENLKEKAINNYKKFLATQEWKELLTELKKPENYDKNNFKDDLRKKVIKTFFPNGENNISNSSFYYFYHVGNEYKDDSKISYDCCANFIAQLDVSYNKNTENTEGTALNHTITNDERLAVYKSLKNLYDKWLITYSENDFKLRSPDETFQVRKNRYERSQVKIKDTKEYDNFLFIDSLYNDISRKFKVDPGTIYDLIAAEFKNETNYSVYEFMADICQKNKLLFLALPVFNNLYDQEGIQNIFSPQIKNTMRENIGSTYVCMYTYEPSHVLGDETQTGLSDDGIPDLAGVVGNTEQTPIGNLFNLNNDTNTLNLTIPAFGVTYARQNQQYFKGISVNMDNPRVTDYSIANLFELADPKADTTDGKPHTVATNIYSIYANRSYNCTVEMMGCVNIMPLMYFQLNNVPMFRGAYIITNVEHHIKAGSFSTLFTGVRVSKNQVPLNTDVFGVNDILGGYGGGVDFDLTPSNGAKCDACKTDTFDACKAISKIENGITATGGDCVKGRVYKPLELKRGCGNCAGFVRTYIEAGLGRKLTVPIKDGKDGGFTDESGNLYLEEKDWRKVRIAKSGFIMIKQFEAGTTRDTLESWTREYALPGDVAFMFENGHKTLYTATVTDSNGNTKKVTKGYGHTAMYYGLYDGKPTWVSDFRQNNVYVYGDGSPRQLPIRIFRYGECENLVPTESVSQQGNTQPSNYHCNTIYYRTLKVDGGESKQRTPSDKVMPKDFMGFLSNDQGYRSAKECMIFALSDMMNNKAYYTNYTNRESTIERLCTMYYSGANKPSEIVIPNDDNITPEEAYCYVESAVAFLNRYHFIGVRQPIDRHTVLKFSADFSTDTEWIPVFMEFIVRREQGIVLVENKGNNASIGWNGKTWVDIFSEVQKKLNG